MGALFETIQQPVTAAWASATTVPLKLEEVGNVTRYELVHELTPSATFLGANQPDGLYRPFENITIQLGSSVIFALPDDAGGEGGVMQHMLNQIDGLGIGYPSGAITAPDLTFVPVMIVFHAGVRPKKPGGVDNPYDLSAFVPVKAKGGANLLWRTNTNAVVDDTVTLSSGTLRATAHRVLGSESEIIDAMRGQGVDEILAMAGCRALTPAWETDVQILTAASANLSLRLNAKNQGFLRRTTFLAQDATGTRPLRAQDELTNLTLKVPGRQKVYFEHSVNNITGRLPIMGQLGVDDVVAYGGAAAKGFFPVDLRIMGETPLERILGLDLRNASPDAVQWGQTVTEYASGDDILVLSEKTVPYSGPFAS